VDCGKASLACTMTNWVCINEAVGAPLGAFDRYSCATQALNTIWKNDH